MVFLVRAAERKGEIGSFVLVHRQRGCRRIQVRRHRDSVERMEPESSPQELPGAESHAWITRPGGESFPNRQRSWSYLPRSSAPPPPLMEPATKGLGSSGRSRRGSGAGAGRTAQPCDQRATRGILGVSETD